MEFLKNSKNGCWLNIYLQPGAKKSEIIGPYDEYLKIKIKAPPIEGMANLELIRFLSKTLGLPQNRITIEKGEFSRKKKVHIEGLNSQSARIALSL